MGRITTFKACACCRQMRHTIITTRLTADKCADRHGMKDYVHREDDGFCRDCRGYNKKRNCVGCGKQNIKVHYVNKKSIVDYMVRVKGVSDYTFSINDGICTNCRNLDHRVCKQCHAHFKGRNSFCQNCKDDKCTLCQLTHPSIHASTIEYEHDNIVVKIGDPVCQRCRWASRSHNPELYRSRRPYMRRVASFVTDRERVQGTPLERIPLRIARYNITNTTDDDEPIIQSVPALTHKTPLSARRITVLCRPESETTCYETTTTTTTTVTTFMMLDNMTLNERLAQVFADFGV